MSDKIFGLLASAVSCLLLLVAGCTQTSTLALTFAPEDSTTYKVITEMKKSVEIEGDLPSDTPMEGGQARNRIEVTFTEQIQSVDDSGNAVAKITVEGLKYFDIVKERINIDFDSTGEKGKQGPFAKLIGQSYTIKISPGGEVIGVPDAKRARAAIRGGIAAERETALALLERARIKARHTIPGLPVAGKNQLGSGDSWSNIKNVSYGRGMGAETYERIYTLKDVEDIGGHRIAIVEMSAIPSSEMAKELHKEQATSARTEMVDTSKTYTGRLELDLTAGKVQDYFEEMQTEWAIFDPSIKPSEDKVPPALRMRFIRRHSLEKID
jgi:hypothetical protein